MLKVKDLCIKISISIFASIFFLLFTEFLVRFITTGSAYLSESNPHYVDSNGWIRLKTNTKCWWYGCFYEINASGFRMTHDISGKRIPRILAIGDSITLGMGVRRTADVWPNKLESIIKLNKKEPVEVINSGVQGWNLLKYDSENNLVPAEYTAHIRNIGPQLQPDIVVYCICLNDVPSQVAALFKLENVKNKARFNLFSERQREWFKRKALYRFSRDGYRKIRFRQLDFSGIPVPSISAEYWKSMLTEISRLKNAVQSLNAELYCIIVPYSFQLLSKNRELLNVNKMWQECLAQNDIPYKDITYLMTENTVLRYYALGDYIHLNSLGHKLVAQQVFDLIKDKLFSGNTR